MSQSLHNLQKFGHAHTLSSGKKLNPVSEYEESDPIYFDESRVLMDRLENLKE